MKEIDHERLNRPATIGDVASLKADLALAMRQVSLALLALRHGENTAFENNLRTLNERADLLWTEYLGTVEKRDDGGR